MKTERQAVAMLGAVAKGALAKGALALGVLLAVCAGPALAQELRTYGKKGSYEDVKFELNDAIIRRGLAIDYTGHINKMLERTGADVGSTKHVYANAEFFMFCSAKLSRDMIEADPTNLGYCPYVVFLYEAADKPGEIVVGYRRPLLKGDAQSQKALGAIDALLDGIVKEAVK
ncbi:MAG TPA: DUF302 domain-containing protein [Hyphomicrobiaceae bacterium]|nr:DUF302 domain-containing protein [Hyphomicrobiaceae bacterium]